MNFRGLRRWARFGLSADNKNRIGMQAMKNTVSKSNLFDVSGKVALVTGASSGIGLHLCGMLLNYGCRVIGASRSASKSAALDILCEKHGNSFFPIDIDVRFSESVDSAFDAIQKKFKCLDIVVNNAGAVTPRRAVDTTQKEWGSVVDTNLTGPFLVSRSAVPMMINGGSIIQIASIGAFKAFVGLSAYSASKAGLIMLARTLALELGSQSIRVNIISPGYVITPMNSEFLAGPQGEKVRKQIPLERFAEASDLDGAILFLSSSASQYVTGACLHVDGGWEIV